MTVPPQHHPQSRSLRSNPKAASTREAGVLAEALVAQWLVQQGWDILQQRWHCRWGELDLVAHSADRKIGDASLTFVEVKARGGGNWDLDGRLSITPQKQAKLWKAAKMFLADHPPLAHLPCRFDVALVRVHPRLQSANNNHGSDRLPPKSLCGVQIELGQPVAFETCCLSLQHYIPSAFEPLE